MLSEGFLLQPFKWFGTFHGLLEPLTEEEPLGSGGICLLASHPIPPPVLWRDSDFSVLFVVSKIERKGPGVFLLLCADIPRDRSGAQPVLAAAWSLLPGQEGDRDGWAWASHAHATECRSDDDEEPVPCLCLTWVLAEGGQEQKRCGFGCTPSHSSGAGQPLNLASNGPRPCPSLFLRSLPTALLAEQTPWSP